MHLLPHLRKDLVEVGERLQAESGESLLAVINDILDFSKIEAGQLKLRPAPFALRRCVEAVSAPFALLARARLLGLPNAMPAVTGARRAVCSGVVVPA